MEALRTQGREQKIDPGHFSRFALEHLQIWRDIIIDWVVLGTEVMVVHYEDFLEDRVLQLRTILGYLSLDVDTRRLQCIQFAYLDFYKRRTSQSMDNILTKELKSKFDQVVEEVNQILRKRGHPIIKRK